MDTPLKILVAEDDLGDVVLLRRAFAKAKVNVPVHFARDGEEVIQYLEGKTPFDNPIDHPLPNLLLLDLKLPRVDGFQVLEWLRVQPGLSRILVVVFTSSNNPEDIGRAYALGANSYLVKPQDPNELVRVVERLQNYWLNINTAPHSRLVPTALAI
jgi:CheY-like chemotaxis protein